jgi:hypothetical protein
MVRIAAGFEVKILEALALQTSPPNLTEVPTVACGHLLRLPLRGHLLPPTQRKAWRLLSG